jgi:zinc-binding alcohol dehydrogenase family protein
MKAVGFTRSLPITDPAALVDFETPVPAATGHDLLVEVKAVSVNPVDYRVRRDMGPANLGTRILGYDAAGIVTAVGSDCRLFKPGDAVYYAGELTRQGSNSQFQLVDERIVGPKPATLSFADAAAMPLTLITAWEGLHEQLRIRRDGSDAGRSLLILGGAGGVGSIMAQLARLAGVKVIATASRPESVAQCQRYGVDLVLDHKQDLKAQLVAAGYNTVDWVFSCAELDGYFKLATEILAPFGGLCTIVAPNAPVDLGLFKIKALRYSHEFMFTRSMFRMPEMIEQHRLLAAAAGLFDQGVLTSTRSQTLGPINAANLRQAHAQLETTHTLGKLVLEGWG